MDGWIGRRVETCPSLMFLRFLIEYNERTLQDMDRTPDEMRNILPLFEHPSSSSLSRMKVVPTLNARALSL